MAKNRTRQIVAILKELSSYTCGNVAYKLDGEYVDIWSTKGDGTFYSTDLCIYLSAFNMYFVSREEGKVVLKVY